VGTVRESFDAGGVPMKTLHVTKIVSIGAVAEGDNPPAAILLFKARDQHRSKVHDPPPPKRVTLTAKDLALAVDNRLTRQARRLAAVAKAAATVGDTIQRMTTRKEPTVAVETYAAVLAEVERRAATVQKEAKESGDPISMAKAKAQAWRDDPELVQRSRNAPKSDHPAPPVDKGLSAEIAAAVHARALEASGRPEMWTKTIPEMRAAIWRTPDGRLLTALSRDAEKRDPDALAKSATHKRAFVVLRKWQENPAAGVADY